MPPSPVGKHWHHNELARGTLFNAILMICFFLQVEDAMLMFDKQTNRHRGEKSFSLLLTFILRGTKKKKRVVASNEWGVEGGWTVFSVLGFPDFSVACSVSSSNGF